MSKKGWYGEKRRHSEAAKKGWKNRKNIKSGAKYVKQALELQKKRSEHAKKADAIRTAKKVGDPEKSRDVNRWKDHPEKSDLENIDTKGKGLSTSKQKKKGIDKKQADEEVGKILSATKGKKKETTEKSLEIPRLQRKLSNGSWVSIDKENTEKYFNIALKKQKQMNKEFGEKYADSPEKLLEMINKKREIRIGDDWYAEIRIKPTKDEKRAKKELLDKQFEKSMKYLEEEDKRFYEQVGKYDKW